jgi:hypothetical protein
MRRIFLCLDVSVRTLLLEATLIGVFSDMGYTYWQKFGSITLGTFVALGGIALSGTVISLVLDKTIFLTPIINASRILGLVPMLQGLPVTLDSEETILVRVQARLLSLTECTSLRFDQIGVILLTNKRFVYLDKDRIVTLPLVLIASLLVRTPSGLPFLHQVLAFLLEIDAEGLSVTLWVRHPILLRKEIRQASML